MGIQVQPSCCRKWYVLTSRGWLLDFDPEAGAFTNPRQTNLGNVEASTGAYTHGFGLQWSPADNCLYTIVWRVTVSVKDADLRRVNLDGTTDLVASGHSADRGLLGASHAIGCGEDGNILGTAGVERIFIENQQNRMYHFQKSGRLVASPQPMTGAPLTSIGAISGLDWGEATLWGHGQGFGQSLLYTVNANTGVATQLADLTGKSNGGGFAYDDGRLYLLSGTAFEFGYFDIAGNAWHALPAITFPADFAAGGTHRPLGLAIAD